MISPAAMKALAAMSACGATAAALQTTTSSVQDWTVLGLLAAVVLGIGARLVSATEKQTAKLGEMTTQIELLSSEVRSLKHELTRLTNP